jgi:phosphoribosyl-dephospho-CoA transferase
MPRGALRRSAPPPHLTAALRSAPPAWRHGWLPDLLGLARVHGGLMWQHLTGETYPRPNSDIDLVPRLDTLDGLDRLVRSLLAIADRVAPRIDGEIVFPNQNAVAWREWLADTPLVMVKQSDRVELVARRALLGPSPTGLIDAATYL